MTTQPLAIEHPLFAQSIARPDHEIDLAEAALRIAQDRYPNLDVGAYLTRLDAMADRVRIVAGPGASAEATLNALLDWFEAEGFRGNSADYYDPRNSYLNAVLERRLGIPLTLALVLLEVGRRLSLPLVPVGLPGHFVVGWAGLGDPFWLDPFAPRRPLSEADCHARVEAIHGRPVTWDEAWLASISHRDVLARMLHNLRSAYLQRGETEHLVPVLEKLLLLHPDDVEAMRELGILMLHAGRPATAARYLEPYLLEHPDAPDHDRLVTVLRHELGRLALCN